MKNLTITERVAKTGKLQSELMLLCAMLRDGETGLQEVYNKINEMAVCQAELIGLLEEKEDSKSKEVYFGPLMRDGKFV